MGTKGGQRGVPFQQAIPQSPGYLPTVPYDVQEVFTQTFLSLLNVSTIQEARQLSSAAIIKANAQQVGASPHGSYTYGPVVNGVFAPALPASLLNSGHYAKNVKVMPSHTLSEGPLLTPPNVQTDSELAAFISAALPHISTSVLDYIIRTLYPGEV